MDLKALQAPLPADMIEFRVSRVVKNGEGIVLLAYKDARADMIRLDEVVGPLNWKREHTRDNHNCIVSIWNEATGQWVSKEDTGTESNTEAQKGLASDSFKRACFNWGIGRELYEYPFMYVTTKPGEVQNGKATFKLNPREWDCYVEHGEDGRPSFIALRDKAGDIRFKWGERRNG